MNTLQTFFQEKAKRDIQWITFLLYRSKKGNSYSPELAGGFLLLLIMVLSPGAHPLWDALGQILAGVIVWNTIITNFARAVSPELTIFRAIARGTSLHFPWWLDIAFYSGLVYLNWQYCALHTSIALGLVIVSDLSEWLLYQVLTRLKIYVLQDVQKADRTSENSAESD